MLLSLLDLFIFLIQIPANVIYLKTETVVNGSHPALWLELYFTVCQIGVVST